MSFNEAEAHAPRIPGLVSFGVCTRRSFNEAEAHAPRIRDIDSGDINRKARFNEAEAHAPRIPISGLTLLETLAFASMRPRRMRLGYSSQGHPLAQNPSSASMRPRRMRLGYNPKKRQSHACSKCFNEAEAHAPRIPGSVKAMTLKNSIASMRPRRMRLGYIFLN